MTLVHRSGPFRALDLSFEVRTDDQDLGLALDRAFASVETTRQPAITYGVQTQGPYRVAVEGEDDTEFRHASEVLPWLLWRINHDVIERSRGLVLHGAAASFDGATAVICGRSGAGKSTLVAGLAASGFSYFTDEAVACEDDGSIRCWTRPLALRERSLSRLSEAFGLGFRDLLPVGVHGEYLVPPQDLGRVGQGDPPPVRAVFLLGEARDDDGETPGTGPTEPQELPAAAGLVELSAHVLSSRGLDRTTVRSLASVLEHATVWQMARDGLDAMAENVRARLH